MTAAVYAPMSMYLGAASGNLSATVYTPATNTNSAGYFEGIGVVSSLASSTNPYSATLQFNLGSTSTSTSLVLRALAFANATSGTAKFTVNDGLTAPFGKVGTTSLTAETQSSVTWTTADSAMETLVTLATSPTSNGILTTRIDFNSTGGWSLAAQSVWVFDVRQGLT